MADVKFGAFAGIRNTVPGERLTPADLVEALNVDIDNGGRVARRPGSVLRLAGAAHSLWSSGQSCLFVRGAELHLLRQLAGTADASEVVARGLTPDAPMNYLELNGRVYWTNGAETGVIERGVSRSWGMTVPPPPGLASLPGTLAPGQYQAGLTYLREDGQESGTGMAVTFTLEQGGVRLTWAAPPDPAIVAVGVYLTEPNGKVLYQAGVGDVADGVAEVTGSALSLPCETQWLDAPPAGQCLAFHRGRILIAAGAHLLATTALGYEYVDLRDYVAIDDTTIRFVAGVEHGVFVGTEQNVYFMAGDRFEDMTLKTVVEGAAVARSLVHVDGFAATGNAALAGQQVVLFATAHGVCMGSGDGTVINLTGERYRFEAAASGAACLRQDDALSQYLLFMPAA